MQSPTQGLVALVGLRTLGFEKGRPAGASRLWARANPGFGCPCRATHPGLCRDRPYRGLGIVGTGLPRVWSPLQGYVPWALKRVAPLGLRDCGYGRTQGLVALAGLRTLGFEKGRPAGAYPAARQLAKELDYRGIIPPPALHGIKGPRCGKGLCCGSPPAGLRDCNPGLTPTAEQAPIGATPTKPRVRSPERATKPWVSHNK